MSTESDSQKIHECINQMLFTDVAYRDCVLRSGLFLPKISRNFSGNSFLANNERNPGTAMVSALDLTPDLVEIQCSSNPANPSEGCCNAVQMALECQASDMPKSHECKRMLDQVVWNTYECPRIHTADVVGAILTLVLAGGLFSLRYISRSERSQVWLRQLWGLLVKNWRMAKHRWGRQFKGVFIAMVLFGIVIALLKLTGEISETYEITIPNTKLSWSFTFTGPDELRATILENLRVVAGLLFIIAFTYPLAQVVLSIVQEKEFLILEAMKVTGLYDSVLQLSWCLSYLVSFLPLCILTALITHFGMILPNFRISLLILFFCSFCAAMVSLSLAFTAFFENTRPAIIFILLVTFVLSFLIYFMPDSQSQQGLMCLVAPACLGLGISNALASTSYGSGFRMAYLTYKNRDHILSMEGMIVIMFLDAIIYAVIGWYLDKILPKKVGIRYPWHFIFHKSFWVGHKAVDASEIVDLDDFEDLADAVLEPATSDHIELAKTNRCIRIIKLSRKFKTPGMKKRKVALDRLNLTLYEGQITSLLGHNGAGKTTLIRILCGLLQPTSGDTKVFGHSILKDMPTIRRSLGMCPQHDILFEDMTCYENLWLFAALKGVPFRKMKSTIAESLAELGLLEKIHEKVENLSGGQKRKLCVAIAFIGKSRVVFLDEPTSGMDPFSRRFTWEVLLKNKKERIIILTTHFMDEAEVLGDRIAIMNDGRLCCYGTSLFLKQQFGSGYTVSLSANKETDQSSSLLNRVYKIVDEIIPGAKCISTRDTESSFQFPPQTTSRFPQLFRALEAFGNALEFGISNCTLEDVFLTVAQKRQDSGSHVFESGDGFQNVILEANSDSGDQLLRSDFPLNEPRQIEVQGMKYNQNEGVFGAGLWTMVMKRWWLAKRDRRQFVLLVLLPIAFLFLPIVLPDIEIVQFVEKGDYVNPVPGPPTCNPADAFNPMRSCSSPDLSDCLENGVQVLPQHLSYTWMRNVDRCRRDPRGWNFCQYVPFICNPSACCDFQDYRSLLYPCQTYTFLNGGLNIHNANVYCPSSLLASIQGAVNAFIKSLAVLLAFLFCPSMIIAHTVMETESHHNTKFQQLVSGVRKLTYWTGAAIWDFSTIFVTISAACVIIMYYTGPLKDTEDAYFVVVALFIAYGLAVVPSVYLLSFRFSSAPHALAMLLVFNIASGAGLGIIAYIMRAFAVPIPGSLTLTSFELYSYSRYVLLALPAFNLIDGLLRLQTNTIQVCIQRFDQRECSQAGTMTNGFRLLALNFLYLGLLLIVCFIGIAFKETQPKAANEESTRSKIRRKVKKHWRTALSLFSGSFNPEYELEDIDVKRERERIQSRQRAFRDPLEIHGLSKTYSNGRTALNELWLGVRSGECFGYLGVNGAGKTTTLKCITGFQRPSSGTAFIDGYDIVKDIYSSRKRSGYCPQFDALFELLSVEEHLRMYCMIRGIRLSAVPIMIEAMQLGMYRNVPSGYLSGGNKRKLSAAIAMIGCPRVIFLDEPSTGMDPHAKRFLWRVIAGLVKASNAALVLTTHSMEECEALCSRVAILIDGQLQCLGSIQHLKSKFGRGYTVEFRTKRPDPETVDEVARTVRYLQVTSENLSSVCGQLGCSDRAERFLSSSIGSRLSGKQSISLQEFASWWANENIYDSIEATLRTRWLNVILKSKHGQHVVFEIPDHQLLLSELFERLESIDRIEYYSVSQTSLEEIFNTFARRQSARTNVLSPH